MICFVLLQLVILLFAKYVFKHDDLKACVSYTLHGINYKYSVDNSIVIRWFPTSKLCSLYRPSGYTTAEFFFKKAHGLLKKFMSLKFLDFSNCSTFIL